MSLILAIEPDRRQASRLTVLANGPLNVELVVGDTTERAFEALGPRVPDLVLTSQLLSPKDESALAERLRELDAAGAHVQTLVIPVLGSTVGGKKRPVGGLLGRLRRSAGQDKESAGCDPAVFGAQITEYLERAATERAALAAAQADLEAAWAEEPPPAPPQASRDHTDFGEFAAIPIPTLPVPPVHSPVVPMALAPTNTDGQDAELVPATRTAPVAAPASSVSSVAGATAIGAGQVEGEWEEITLDAAMAESHGDLAAETVDLDAFVEALHTTETTANAQPVIPVVDLTGGAVDDDLHEIRRNEDTVAAIFQAAEPALDLGDELERAVLPPEASAQRAPTLLEPVLAVAPVENTAPFELGATFEASIPVDASANLEAASVPPSITASELAAAFEAAIAPVTATLAVDVPAPPSTGWQDLLSAIRRDISQMKTDEPAPPQPLRAELDLSREPLVFPVRPVLSASAIADAMPVRAERLLVEPDAHGLHPLQVAHSLEASLQASLSAPLALTPEPMDALPASEVGELRAAIEAQLANAIKTSSENAFAPDLTTSDAAADDPVIPHSDVVLDAGRATDEPAAESEREPEPMFTADDPVIADFEHALESSMGSEEPAPHAAAPPPSVEPVFEGLIAAEAAPDESLEPPSPVSAPASPVDDARFAVEAEVPLPVVSAAPAPGVTEAPQRESIRNDRGSKHKRKRRNEQAYPAAAAADSRVGDWGFFDPHQVGFGALVAKLNEVTRRGQHAALLRQ